MRKRKKKRKERIGNGRKRKAACKAGHWAGQILAVFPPTPHPAGFTKSNPSPEHNQQYPHGFGCCGAGKITAGCAGWVLFLHFYLVSSPSFSCLLICKFFFLLHNHNPKSEPINNGKEREIGQEISLDPIHERGREREREKTWIVVMEKRQIFVSMVFVLLLWLVGANEEEEAESKRGNEGEKR